jgi:hypothetical protein
VAAATGSVEPVRRLLQSVMWNHTRSGGDQQDPLLIDLASAAERPLPEDIRLWAQDQRGFISSVMDELKAERRAVADGIEQFGAEPVWFEQFGARDADPSDAYTSEVASSTVYIGILGQRYGRLLPTRLSASETEYRFAEEHGLRICMYPLDVPDREGREQAFLDEVWQFHTAPIIRTADLPTAVVRRLERIAAEELSPWCKLGHVLFRASSVVETTERIVVTAKVRSADVAHALDSMGADQIRRFDGQLTWHGRCRAVRVTDMEVTTTASTARSYRMTLERTEDRRNSMLDVSYDKMSADDLTEMAINGALGNPQPLNQQRYGGFSDLNNMGDPLAGIRGRRIPDEFLRPLAQLLFTEALVGSGRIARLTKFRLGADVAGKRRIEIGWEPPRRYSNARPEQRHAAGFLSLADARDR